MFNQKIDSQIVSKKSGGHIMFKLIV